MTTATNYTMRIVANVLFIVASLTDLLDGKIARKYNLVTNFGKFMDPLADKLLVCSALICLIELGQLPAWMVIIIISREFIISGFRLVAADNGVVIAASYWGKFKTTFQMAAVILMIFNIPALTLVTNIVVVICGCPDPTSYPWWTMWQRIIKILTEGRHVSMTSGTHIRGD